MKFFQGILVALIIMCVVSVAFVQTYKAGYRVGWSDAHCGAGRECEAGQE